MQLKIIHETDYQFDSEVFLEPHYLRLMPQQVPGNKLESFQIKISPEASGSHQHLDPENNLVQLCWFDEMTDHLKVITESIVEINEFNPFNFLLHPSTYGDLPFIYPKPVAELLRGALECTEMSRPLIEYGEKIKHGSQFNSVRFLTDLTMQIFRDFKVITRHIGSPYEPGKTFEQKNGSCRDLAWMQIQLFRHMGIASRFISGYYYIPNEQSYFELHGWLEAYLPGAGWLGLDPSHGMVTGKFHIPIARSANFENAMTVTGAVRGDASAQLTTNIAMELLQPAVGDPLK